jgi:hypothetical protein
MINNKKMLNKLKMNIAMSNFQDELNNKYTSTENVKERIKFWQKYKIERFAIISLVTMFIGTGVVFASYNIIDKFWNNKDGVKTALQYGYVQNIDMNYNEQNNLGIKIDSLLIDNSNFALVLNYNNTFNLKNVDDILLNDLVIKDENNNIIFEDGNANNLSTSYTSEVAIDKGTIKQAILLENLNNTYPNSQKIYISFSKVTLFKSQKNIKEINGPWNFEINVTDKFLNRKAINYTANKNEDVSIIKAELTSTGLDIEMILNKPLTDEDIIRNMKIQDENGKDYSTTGIIDIQNKSTKPKIKASFSITQFNAQDNLKLIIKTDNIITIDLNKYN